MNRTDLIEELTEDILTYVMHGAFPEDRIAEEIKYDDLDSRFEDYERLMDLHFILQDDVIEFVEELPHRLRGIKTQTRNVSRKRRGTVDGRINWSATIQQRYARNPKDSSLFVCDNRSEHYDIPENIVLKRLLSIIHSTLKDCQDYLEEDHDWVNERWDEDLIEDMMRIMERNVHVTRIKDPDQYEPTDRMLDAADGSRQEIYQEAADLIGRRKDLFAGEKDQIKRVLNETAITPDDDETLFELYVLFRFIATIESMEDDGGFTLKTIKHHKQEIASLTTGSREIRLYHDSSGEEDMSFLYDRSDDETRPAKVHQETKQVIKQYFGKEPDEQTGRPDVIVLEVIDEEANEYEYLITEVKNSTNKDTIRQGIKETLEYLAFLTVDDEPAFEGDDRSEIFGSGYNGVLVVQDLDEEPKEVDDQEDQSISILQAGQLQDEEGPLREVIERVV